MVWCDFRPRDGEAFYFRDVTGSLRPLGARCSPVLAEIRGLRLEALAVSEKEVEGNGDRPRSSRRQEQQSEAKAGVHGVSGAGWHDLSGSED